MERRQHERIARPVEAQWSSASAQGSCRLVDISVGGCFVQTIATPAAGENTIVTIWIGQHSFTLSGRVVYAEANIGFAMEFNEIPPDELDKLRDVLMALANAPID